MFFREPYEILNNTFFIENSDGYFSSFEGAVWQYGTKWSFDERSTFVTLQNFTLKRAETPKIFYRQKSCITTGYILWSLHHVNYSVIFWISSQLKTFFKYFRHEKFCELTQFIFVCLISFEIIILMKVRILFTE